MPNDRATQFFLAHLAAYVAVTLICAAINLWLTPENLWFVWVLLGWGIAVATHGLALYLRKTRRKDRIFIDKKTRSFTVHAFAYVTVILLLLLVNVTVTPKVCWFYWVALGWGTGLAFHAWCAFGKRRQQASGAVQDTKSKTPRRKSTKRSASRMLKP
jgi:hypothetical protein